jgi:hypothetical protein
MITSLPELLDITISALSPLTFLSDSDDLLHAHEASPEKQRVRSLVCSTFSSRAYAIRNWRVPTPGQQLWVRRVFRHGGVVAGRRKIATTLVVLRLLRKHPLDRVEPGMSGRSAISGAITIGKLAGHVRRSRDGRTYAIR